MLNCIKRVRLAIKNKKGDMYIYAVCIFLCVAMLFSFGVTYLGLVQQAKALEENSQRVLDASVMESSIIIYNSIKNGTNVLSLSDDDLEDKREKIEQSFNKLFSEELSLVKNGSKWERKSPNGVTIYWVKDLTVECSSNMDSKQYLFITADFKLVIPTLFYDGKESSLWNVELPIHVESSLTDKKVNSVGGEP